MNVYTYGNTGEINFYSFIASFLITYISDNVEKTIKLLCINVVSV